jgi:hypothetical protein
MNQDPDVFKRPCFVRALHRSLEKPKAYEGLTDTVEVKVTEDRIPAQEIEGFRGLLTTLLQPAYLPRPWGRAQLYIPYPVRSVTELRGETRVLVGHEVNRSPEANEAKHDMIQAGWTIGGIEVLPRTSRGALPSRSTMIRLRLHGDERLEVRWRSKHDEVLSGSREWEEWVFFDKVAFGEFLNKIFRVPFAAPDDFLIRGYDTEYDGVAVFHGSIVSRERGRVWVGGENPPQRWWQQMRLLVTDSDPQYFCVLISLRTRDVLAPANP